MTSLFFDNWFNIWNSIVLILLMVPDINYDQNKNGQQEANRHVLCTQNIQHFKLDIFVVIYIGYHFYLTLFHWMSLHLTLCLLDHLFIGNFIHWMILPLDHLQWTYLDYLFLDLFHWRFWLVTLKWCMGINTFFWISKSIAFPECKSINFL